MQATRHFHHDSQTVQPDLSMALDYLDSFGDGAGRDLDDFGTLNIIRPIRYLAW
jgi:hypothetical protein